ncbi:hypothetical protein MKZ25_03105 [Solibacillus sp. FSL W7-1464]|uniref:hypothetical protein n=1 Tax=Solibacillus sp. FSL W7-1464 TaxID=2921706 RepID=UPI0030FAB704
MVDEAQELLDSKDATVEDLNKAVEDIKAELVKIDDVDPTIVTDPAPTITSATGVTVTSVFDGTTINFAVDQDATYTKGTIEVSEENVSAIITYGENGPLTLDTISEDALLELFAIQGGKGNDVLGQTLIDNSGVTVTLVDLAGNETTYTVNFIKAALEEEEEVEEVEEVEEA